MPSLVLQPLVETTNGRNNRHHCEMLYANDWCCAYLDEHTRLVVRVGCEGLSLLGWNGCVSFDQDSHDTSSGLNTQGERGDVKKQQVLDILRLVTRQDGSLDSFKEETKKETIC